MRVCAAKGCNVTTARPFFCTQHLTVDSRIRTAEPEWPRDEPDQVAPHEPEPQQKPNEKLRVKWDGFQYVCYHRGTNVTGFGASPGAAIKNWQYWWNIPF